MLNSLQERDSLSSANISLDDQSMESSILVFKPPLIDESNIILTEILGSGASGDVHAGFLSNTRTPVAIKVAHSKEKNKEAFKREQRALTRLSNIPGVLGFHGIATISEKPTLVLERCRCDMFSFLEKTRRLSLPESVAQIYVRQLWHTLSKIHARGEYHLDIKLENILIADDFSLRICDFGLGCGKDRDNELSNESCVGTVGYMAPELLQKEKYSPEKADVWSAAVTAFSILCRMPPYSPMAGKYHANVLVQACKDLRTTLRDNFGICLDKGSRTIVAFVQPESLGAYAGVRAGSQIQRIDKLNPVELRITFSCITEDWYYRNLRLKRWKNFWNAIHIHAPGDPEEKSVRLNEEAKATLQMPFEVNPECRPRAAKMLSCPWLARKSQFDKFDDSFASYTWDNDGHFEESEDMLNERISYNEERDSSSCFKTHKPYSNDYDEFYPESDRLVLTEYWESLLRLEDPI